MITKAEVLRFWAALEPYRIRWADDAIPNEGRAFACVRPDDLAVLVASAKLALMPDNAMGIRRERLADALDRAYDQLSDEAQAWLDDAYDAYKAHVQEYSDAKP